MEVAETALLGRLEPKPISGCYEDELPRVRRAILRGSDSRLARFREQVNRNAFLLGCATYTDGKPEEHLIVGYGFRHGTTTKIESLHHVIGSAGSVGIPHTVGHTMWDFYGRHEDNEILIFHNHRCNPLNVLLDNPPLASLQDRQVLSARALNGSQLLRRVLGRGRIMFFLGENGYVKEFNLPSLINVFGRLSA